MLEIAGVNVFQIVGAVITLVVAYLTARIASKAIEKMLEGTPLPMSTGKWIVRTSKYATYLVGFLVAMSVFHIDLTSLAVGLGAFSIAISFAMNNVIQNFVSGLLVQTDGVFKVGDEIKVQNHEGRVLKLGVRKTIIESVDGNIVIIPNSIFATNPITKKKQP